MNNYAKATCGKTVWLRFTNFLFSGIVGKEKMTPETELYVSCRNLERKDAFMSQTPILAPMVKPLLEWYYQNARVLPWRSDPTPYHVWISEIMLQQTRVEAVREYYRRFLEELPDIASLAQVPEQKLLKLWEGLGYYNRARNLKKAAQQVMDQYGGQLPGDYELLQKLPGIGRYTAGAIASIAFGLPVPAVDGNVLRILSRVMGDRSNISRPQTKLRYEELLLEVYPMAAQMGRAGDFAQALMELGAMVCLPNGEPKCLFCPWNLLCQARAQGTIEEIPVKDEKKKRTVEKKTVFLLRWEEKIAIRQRPDTGLLASLWEFPSVEGQLLKRELPQQLSQWGIEAKQVASLGKAKHIFTHVEWQMVGFEVWTDTPGQVPGAIWVDVKTVQSEYPLPNALKAYQKF